MCASGQTLVTASPYCQFNADLAFGDVSARFAEARLADD